MQMVIKKKVGILEEFSKIYIYGVGLATFDIIKQNTSDPFIVNASQMFDKLLDTLLLTAYENLQVCIYFCYDKLFRVLNYSVLLKP